MGMPVTPLAASSKPQVREVLLVIEFFLLGRVTAVADDAELSLGGTKRTLLLALLLMAESRSVSSDKLVDVLNAEEPEAKRGKMNQKGALQSLIKNLKTDLRQGDQAIDSRLRGSEHGYRMDVDEAAVDLRRFRAKERQMAALARRDPAGNASEIARLGREALHDWGGVDARIRDCEPLANLTGSWATAEKRDLLNERSAMVTTYLEAEFKLGNGGRFVEHLRDLWRFDRSDQRRFRLLLRAYCLADMRLRAIQEYENFERYVRTAKGQEIDRATEQLYQRIRDQDPEIVTPSAEHSERASMPSPKEPEDPKEQTNNYGATFNQPFSIAGSANVQGLVFGGENVSLNFGDQGALVPVPRSETVPDGWQGGADVDVGDRTYLLHTPYLCERRSADQAVVYREARALRHEAERTGRSPEYVWLRQVGIRAETPEAQDAFKALFDEHGLLTELDRAPGFPRPAGEPRRAPDGRTATLAVTWPSTSFDGTPCPGLDTMIDPGGGPLDPFQVYGLLHGLAGLCEALVRLHRLDVAHRQLTPAAVLAVDRGRLALRDLGLAARPFRNGEGDADHQAPEQRTGAGRPAGPHTDVYRLAAVTYHLMTGSPPDSRAPLPVAGQVLPDLPERFGRTLDAALAADPAERPGMAALGAAFQNARKSMR